MAKTKISEFSSTPANNTDIDSINIAEGCAPSGINDAIRELMAQLKDFQTGAQGDSFNGPIGTSTAAAGAFTTLSATGAITSTLATGSAPLVIASTTKVANLNVDLLDGADWASPAALGSTTPAAVSATTLSASSTVTLSGGTANGVAYLNGSKVVTSGSALTYDGTNFATTGGIILDNAKYYYGKNAAGSTVRLLGINAGNVNYIGAIDSGPTDVIFGAASTLTNQAWYVGGSEQMRLTSTGLGIGTSSPSTKLDVYDASSPRVAVSGPSTATGYLIFRDTTSGVNKGYVGYEFANDAIPFATAGSERMRLDSSGNLGLGVTPASWKSEFKALQLNSQTALFGSADSTFLQTNAYINSAGSNLYIGTGFATRYRQDAGVHSWYTAPSGTAGNAITFTQAMTLTAAGDLGVGTTTPDIFGRFYTRSIGFSSSGTTSLQVNGSTYGTIDVGAGGTRTGNFVGSSTEVQLGTVTSIPLLLVTNGIERARIDSSGNLLVGTTTFGQPDVNGAAIGSADGAFRSHHATGTSSGTIHAYFTYGGLGIGSITQNGTTGVLYNLTSDYRLKNNPIALTGSGAFIDALKPKTWDWHDGSGKGVGFIAHEFMEVAKYSGNGEKDAVDSDGNPLYQSIQPSSSEVMAYLVAEIQSLRKRLADAGL